MSKNKTKQNRPCCIKAPRLKLTEKENKILDLFLSSQQNAVPSSDISFGESQCQTPTEM